MSLLRRIDRSPRSLILRNLLEKLTQADDFKNRIDEIATAENITLSDEERQKLQEIPVDYLLNTEILPKAANDNAAAQSQPKVSSIDREVAIGLKSRIASKLLNDDKANQITDRRQFHEYVVGLINELLAEEDTKLSRVDRQLLAETITNEIIGYSILQPLLDDDAITDILVIGPKNIYVTRNGHREKASQTFENDEHLLRILDRMVAPLGKRIDEREPMVSVQLENGFLMSAIMNPIAVNGMCVSIRRHKTLPDTDEFVRLDKPSDDVLSFLRACVQARLNILIVGGENVGKTTLLNVLGNFIADEYWVAVIEDKPEIRLELLHEEVLYLQTRPQNFYTGKSEISTADLIHQATRMGANTLIVGEIKAAMFALIHSQIPWMSTYQSGSLESVVPRLTALEQLSGFEISIETQINLVIYIARLADGLCKVARIAEFIRQPDSRYRIKDLFSTTRSHEENGGINATVLRPATTPSETLLKRLTEYPVDKALQEQVRQLFK